MGLLSFCSQLFFYMLHGWVCAHVRSYHLLSKQWLYEWQFWRSELGSSYVLRQLACVHTHQGMTNYRIGPHQTTSCRNGPHWTPSDHVWPCLQTRDGNFKSEAKKCWNYLQCEQATQHSVSSLQVTTPQKAVLGLGHLLRTCHSQ